MSWKGKERKGNQVVYTISNIQNKIPHSSYIYDDSSMYAQPQDNIRPPYFY